MVEVGVVKHHKAGVAECIGPEKVVVRRVAHLVNRQVVGGLPATRYELMRGEMAGSASADGFIDEDVDIVTAAQGGDQVGAVEGDAGADGRHRAEPGEAHVTIVWRAPGAAAGPAAAAVIASGV